jgi:hypothetical protein
MVCAGGKTAIGFILVIVALWCGAGFVGDEIKEDTAALSERRNALVRVAPSSTSCVSTQQVGRVVED